VPDKVSEGGIALTADRSAVVLDLGTPKDSTVYLRGLLDCIARIEDYVGEG